MPIHSFIFAVLIFFASLTHAEVSDTNKTQADFDKQQLIAQKIKDYQYSLEAIESQISDENMWTKSYSSYLTSLDVKQNLEAIKKRIKYLSKHSKTAADKDELIGLISKENILASQIDKLKGTGSSAPFSDLITPPNIDKVPEIHNPFDILTGLSMIKTLNANLEEYKKKRESLVDLIDELKQENEIYKKILQLQPDNKQYAQIYKNKQTQLEMFERALDTMNVTMDVYQKRLDIAEININKGIEKQVYRLIKIGTAILFVFFIFFLLKLVVKKYITDNERFYMANKIITFTNFTIIILILFFNYMENVSYLVTILGFASAGIAIAMKDWFMSILGWLVIVFGGSIHVGDRIRVDMEGMKYVGDVLDISLLRMTILEDITLTSIMHNRRAGRIIFIPNNYVFTKMIANYTHNSLKTVWDGVKITITFDSNHKKAMHLVKEITKKFSKGYTDITRKQLNKLRQHYNLKNTNVEPRIYSFIESNGIDIEAWYLTNAYATLTLRSVISTEILDAFKEADDITIAYPTQKLHVSMQSEAPSEHNGEIV
ncbi:mechanosensitive ion channel domain-containing protein [Sulfurimonas autotrophica]|uniref:MscS Mechanosensitive ion channel n=1 Tax=Sulfurimonas autotrophica (strain ATCC BAA-671 / DSM 16294 / JCM 11897 / OK10) TaxID=563040 RepID=E0UTE9_SULAO|nr:mechanosensitive ion channel domain-containing protein [Sulfurimonas autotrophica]ADN09314.1 MscS Mechanosensitive ion channel [Sulfurimonas autotrophica DSM 16294]